LKVYTVFNTDQCDLPEGVVPDMMMVDIDHDPVAAAAAIAAGYQNPPTVQELDGRAYYRPSHDLVSLPPLKRFETPESYYSTMFHELGHSTGHRDRLNRLAGDSIFGDHAYSEEELVAEMTAAFLCGRAGIINSTIDSSVAYLGSWSKRLKGDKKLIVRAASQAQKAADMILGDSVAA
jgi:antirestriction protein ArdC